MADDVIGGKWQLDVTDLKAGLSEANRLIRISESEFKATAASLGDWSKSADGLTAKIDSLNTIVDVQEQKVSALKEQYKLVAAEQGENSKAAQDLEIKINNETAALNKNKLELDQSSKSLENMQKPADQLGDSLDDMSDSAKNAGKESLKTGDIIKANLISETIISGVKALGSAFMDLAKYILGSAEATREYRKDLSKLEQNTNDAGLSFDFVKDQLSLLNAITGETDSSIEGLSNLMAAGFDETGMQEALDSLIGAVIKFPDTLKIESLADSLQETIASGSATGQFAELIERSGFSVDQFNLSLEGATTEAQRHRVALDFLAKSGLAQVSEEYQKTNESIIDAEKAQFDFNDTIASFGQKIEPVITLGQQLINDVLVAMSPYIDDLIESLQENMPIIVENIKGFLMFIIDNGDDIIAILGGIAAGLLMWNVVGMVTGLVNAIKAFQKANEGATIAQALLNIVMNANPIGIIITAIAALVAGIMILWTTNEDFREAVKKIFGDIVKFIGDAVDNIVKFFTETIPNTLKNVGKWFADVGKNIVEGVWNGIKNMGTWIADKVKGFFTGIVDGIKDLLGIHSPSRVFADIGENMAAGLGVGFANEMDGINKDIQNAIPTSLGNVSVGANGSGSAVATGSGVNFVQNIYSPKALSPYEVYRQTKNASQVMALSLVKG